jgi:hypothetical protein
MIKTLADGNWEQVAYHPGKLLILILFYFHIAAGVRGCVLSWN